MNYNAHKEQYHSSLPFMWCVLIIIITISVEHSAGRSWLGTDGKFGWWEGNIWSSENSQRLSDPYAFSHIAHGILFYAIFHLCVGTYSVRSRFAMAVTLEALWEMLENSPVIIERYRAVTISLGYNGDSILNSISDIAMMALGFTLARHAKPWVCVLVLLGMELGCLYWIRDNLTLNIIMLVHPLESIKQWQAAGHM